MIKSSPETEADRALAALRTAIVEGDLPPGMRLTVAALSGRLGFGTMPLRQALLRLTGEGLVESDPHRGARVVRLDATRIRGLYRLRAAVLSILIPDVVAQATAAELDGLEDLEQVCEAAVTAGDIGGFLSANQRFHHALHAIGRDPDALGVLDRTWPLVDALRRRHGFGQERLAGSIASHRVLLIALRARDVAAATAESVRSSNHAMNDLLALEAVAVPLNESKGPVRHPSTVPARC
ncbi:GntR family transcriptional regulator [Muricoccus radiodurans]|uniref:GntR family transcriptional regulator n=1 Tax=Muricoccus radiodurans TaxID=2231721 RepID=UPI003CF27FD7